HARAHPVTLERRNRPALAGHLLGDPVEVEGGDARLRLSLKALQHLGDDLSGAAHPLEVVFRFELELHHAAFRRTPRTCSNTASVPFPPSTSRSSPFS